MIDLKKLLTFPLGNGLGNSYLPFFKILFVFDPPFTIVFLQHMSCHLSPLPFM